MHSSNYSGRLPTEHRRRRSRSPKVESDDEGRQRRRRDGRNNGGSDRDRRHRDDGRTRRETSHRDRNDEDRTKRRHRSPIEELSSRPDRDHESMRRDAERSSRSNRDVNHRRHRSQEGEDEKRVSRRQNGPLPSQNESFSLIKDPSRAPVPGEDKPMPEKQKPNLAATGLLAAATNTIQQADGSAIVLKYHEPPEARKPPTKDQWKLFVFKGAEIVDTIELSLRSCWLVGRELSIVDLAAEHPSISKQHAVIQFRYIEKKNEYGDKLGKVKPYLIDLESANGTMLNKEPVPGSRYLELRDKDMIQFGDSTREYVLMLPPRD